MAENWAETTRTVGYQMAVKFALNEMPGKLKALATQGSYSDKKEQIEDRFGDLYADEIDERNGDTKNTDIDVNRRWLVKPKRQAVAPLIDPDDVMATKVDLKSPLATQVAKAVRRAQDDRWLQGFYGTALTGEEGTISVPFAAANILPVDITTTGTPTGLTLNKLIEMQALMQSLFVDTESENPLIIITSKQVKDLLKINQYTSKDWNPLDVTALQSGKITHFMGFDFLKAEIGNPKAYKLGASLTVDGNGYRRVPVLVRSGMHFGTWLDFDGRISERDDKNYSEQIWGATCGAATRVLEDKCFQMLCLES